MAKSKLNLNAIEKSCFKDDKLFLSGLEHPNEKDIGLFNQVKLLSVDQQPDESKHPKTYKWFQQMMNGNLTLEVKPLTELKTSVNHEQVYRYPKIDTGSGSKSFEEDLIVQVVNLLEKVDGSNGCIFYSNEVNHWVAVSY